MVDAIRTVGRCNHFRHRRLSPLFRAAEFVGLDVPGNAAGIWSATIGGRLFRQYRQRFFRHAGRHADRLSDSTSIQRPAGYGNILAELLAVGARCVESAQRETNAKRSRGWYG